MGVWVERGDVIDQQARAFLNACDGVAGNTHKPEWSEPYLDWNVGLAAPRHMQVWVETVDVTNTQGKSFGHVFGGIPSYTSTAEGWHNGTGASKRITDIGFPAKIRLRWQSLVEPKTYQIAVDIPQWVRDEMVSAKQGFCKFSREWRDDYRNYITFGMAPGGIVKVWVGGACLDSIEVGRYQAEVDPRGPYEGRSNGRYIKLEPENKDYIEKHGIPYGTW